MLYETVSATIREAIRSGEYPVGARLPAESVLLEQFGVSAITLRRALDILRNEGYVTRRPRVGTVVVSDAPDAAGGSSDRIVGLVVPNFDDAFGTRVVEGALSAAGGAHVVLERTEGDHAAEDAAIRSLVAAGASGIVLLPSSSEFVPPVVLELIAERYPVVILDRRYDAIPVSAVVSDNIEAGRLATEHLLDLGHRRIALVTAASHVSSTDDRRRGWVRAHARRDVVLDESLAMQGVASTLPGATTTPDDDRAALRRFVEEHPDASAFIAGEYNIALLLRDALGSAGRTVPEAASVVCFDHPAADFDRALFRFTHVAQDQRALGRTAVEQVLAQIAEPGSVSRVVVPVELVPGRSTRRVS